MPILEVIYLQQNAELSSIIYTDNIADQAIKTNLIRLYGPNV